MIIAFPICDDIFKKDNLNKIYTNGYTLMAINLVG